MEILADTREKQPWDFIFFPDVTVTTAKLNLGDYTSSKLKDLLFVERKASPSEIAINLGNKKDKERFFTELEKAKEYKHKFIICEFSESDVYKFPSGLPHHIKSKMRITGRGLMKMIKDAEQKFGIPFLFFDDKNQAELYVYTIISSLEKKYEGNIHTRK
jgi:ERCC4-type nuclease